MRHEPKRFPGSCRRFLAGLVDHVDQLEAGPAQLDSAAADHVARCGSCADRLKAARRQTVLLSALPRLEAPLDLATGLADVYDRAIRCGEHEVGDALHEALTPVAAPEGVAWQDAPGGLADVYDRAIRRGEHEVGEALREALTPVGAPQDVAWQDAPEPVSLAPSLRNLWPERSAPGWMWSRIRAEIHSTEDVGSKGGGAIPAVASQRRRWFDPGKFGLLAAALLVSLFLLIPDKDFPGSIKGTRPIESIVWHVRSEPIDPSLSLYTLVQIGRR